MSTDDEGVVGQGPALSIKGGKTRAGGVIVQAQGEVVKEAICFDGAAYHPLSGSLEVAFSPRVSYFQGRLSPEFLLLDWVRREE